MRSAIIILLLIVVSIFAFGYVDTSGLSNMQSEPEPIPDTDLRKSYEYHIHNTGEISGELEYMVTDKNGFNTISLSMQLPDADALTVTSVSDQSGELTDYTVEDNILTVQTNEGKLRKSEIVEVDFEFKNRQRLSENMYASDFIFPSRSNQSIKITSDTDIQTVTSARDSDYTITDNNKVIVQNNETTQIRVIHGQPDVETEHYVFGENVNLETELPYSAYDEDFDIVRNIVGIDRKNTKVPVILVPDEEFESESRVQGTYRNGVIEIPKSTITNTDISRSVLAHETVHALNGQIGLHVPKWYDEGVAMYTQNTVAEYRGERYIYPFVDEQYYPEDCNEDLSPNTDCRRYSSKNSNKELTTYIESNRTYVTESQTWNSNVQFRYAYSALFIKESIAENEYATVTNISKNMYANKSVFRSQDNVQRKNDILYTSLGRSDRVCAEYRATETDINNCISEYNSVYLEEPNSYYNTISTDIEHRQLLES